MIDGSLPAAGKTVCQGNHFFTLQILLFQHFCKAGASPLGKPGAGRCPSAQDRVSCPCPVLSLAEPRGPVCSLVPSRLPGRGITMLGAATGPRPWDSSLHLLLVSSDSTRPPPASPPGAANWVHVAADGESIKTIFFSTPAEKPGPCCSQALVKTASGWSGQGIRDTTPLPHPRWSHGAGWGEWPG